MLPGITLVAPPKAGSVAPIGNLILATNWADYLTKANAAVVGDVVSINHAGYTPTAAGVVYSPTHAKGAGGATFIGASNQPVVLSIDGQANMNCEFVNWYGDNDFVRGNETNDIASVASSLYCRNSSGFVVRGSVFKRGMWPMYCYNNSNFVLENNLSQFARADCLRLDVSPSQFQIKGNYHGDFSTIEIMWWDPTHALPPVFQTADPGGGFLKFDKEHNDLIQAVGGAMTDAEISGNYLAGWGQGIFIADNAGLVQTRVKVSGNTVNAADPYQLLFDNAAHLEVSSNVFGPFYTTNPGSSAALITTAGSNIKVGLNTVNSYSPLSVTYAGTTGAAFTGAISGTATAPTAPTFTGTTSNVGNLNTLRQRKSPLTVPSPSAPAPVSLPAILPGTAITAGAKVTARPCLWNPWTNGLADLLYSRFKLDGVIVRASTQGRAAMVYTTAAAGQLTVEFSSDNVTWSSPSAAVTVNPAVTATTLDPATRNSRILLSGSNLIATMDVGADAHALCRSIGKIPAVDGNYYYEIKPAPNTIATDLAGIVTCNGSWGMSSDPSDFGAGKAQVIYPGGTAFYSGGTTAYGTIGSAGNEMDGTHWFGMYFRRSGGSGGTVKIFVRCPTGWASNTGDPTGAGAGIDISGNFGGGDIYAAAYGYKAGGVQTFNFGATAFNYAASIGTVTLLA